MTILDTDIECMDSHKSSCTPDIEHRQAPSGSNLPRCSKHNNERWDQYENSDLERYADSDIPPDWFDPTLCGERWDDDY